MDAQTIKRWKDGVAFERGRTAVPAGFPALPDIPGGRYWEPEFFALERVALFKRGWVYARHTDLRTALLTHDLTASEQLVRWHSCDDRNQSRPVWAGFSDERATRSGRRLKRNLIAD